MFRLSDCMIGDFPVAEFFGANPSTYIARYNIQGCPGIRFKCPSLTPVLSAAEGFVLEVGMEPAGKGRFLTIVHNGFLTTYAHLNDILVQKDEKVLAGQLIGHSNQSGLTDIPCLLFMVAPCDAAGNKTQENGYGGYIDPMGPEVEWDIKNLSAPITKADVAKTMVVPSSEYAQLVAMATNYKVILNYLQKETEFDNWMKEVGHEPLNIVMNPFESTGGERVTEYLDVVSDEFDKMNAEIEKLDPKEPEPAIPLAKQPNFFVRLWHEIKKFALKPSSDL